MMYDYFQTFDDVLRSNTPEAEGQIISRARNAFLRKYGSYMVTPQMALAVAWPNELRAIRNAGKKCQEVYQNASDKMREEFAGQIEDIMDLKRMFYEEVDEKDRWMSGIDRMILQCIESGALTKEQFEKTVAERLAYTRVYFWDGDEKLVGKVFCKVAKQLHPEVENPQAYIVRITGDRKTADICYTGIDPVKGRDRLLQQLTEAGYQTSMSGRINGLPVRFINCEKIREE